MLSDVRLNKALNDNEIQITVSFKKEDGKLIFLQQEQPILLSSLKSNLYSDRLKLTMGPIVKTLRNKPISAKTRFKNKQNCYDLRKSNDRFTIFPGESIIILTNERIRLNEKYACLVVPRISLSDVGIVVSTAYVDPFYDGILRLHLTNLSSNAYELCALETIAQCFFFELSDPASSCFHEHFKEKSVFFGQTWNQILESDRDPFPTKKDPQGIDRHENLKYQIRLITDFLKKHSIIFVILTNLVIMIGGYTVAKQRIEYLSKTVEQVETGLSPSTSEIIIEEGESYGEKEIVIGSPKSDIISILCNNDEIHYKILSGDVENQCRIIFYTSTTIAASEKYEIGFTYAIVRRLQ